jgi:hypothetical protein
MSPRKSAEQISGADTIRTHFGHQNIPFSTRRYNNPKTPNPATSITYTDSKPLNGLEGGPEKAGVGGSIPSIFSHRRMPSLPICRHIATNRLLNEFYKKGCQGSPDCCFFSVFRRSHRIELLREAQNDRPMSWNGELRGIGYGAKLLRHPYVAGMPAIGNSCLFKMERHATQIGALLAKIEDRGFLGRLIVFRNVTRPNQPKVLVLT